MLLKKGIYFYLRILLFAVYLINGIIAIPKNSVTYDEMDYWSYGKRILKGQPQKIYTYDDASVMPVIALNALPRAAEQVLNPKLLKTDGGFSDIMHGRYVTLVICLLIGVFIYKWSTDLFGERAGLFSLFLFVFCPNINGNAILLNTDAYTALFTLTTFYYFWKFIKESGYKNFILFSASFAVAQLTKYSLFHLLPLFAFFSLIVLIKRKTIFTNWKRSLLRLAVFCSIVLLMMNVAYFFKGTGQSLSEYDFKSSAFRSLQQNTLINRLPLPLPVPHVEGFDVTFHMTELGAGHSLVSGKNYLLGELRAGKGFWNYYLVIFLFKTPLLYLFAFLFLLGVYFVKRKQFKFISAEFIVGFSLLYFLLLFSFLNNVQIGIRHILFFFPLLYVLMGRLMILPWKRSYGAAVVFFVTYSVFSFYFYFPNLISYTNELIPDKKKAYKIMADSNINYNQGNFALAKFMKAHPDVRVATPGPQPGKFVLGVNDYVDVYGTGRFKWLQNFKPERHISHCYLLFTVTESELKEKGIQ